MSRTGQKRTKSTVILHSSRKRRRLEGIPQNPIEPRPSPREPVAVHSANELSWKEVTPPEWLEDAEGFFGLEEIDDIEVVRDAGGRQARFRVCLSSSYSVWPS